jgi:hypothetical protein
VRVLPALAGWARRGGARTRGVPIEERVESRRDDAWRRAAHVQWREFVERAAALG